MTITCSSVVLFYCSFFALANIPEFSQQCEQNAIVCEQKQPQQNSQNSAEYFLPELPYSYNALEPYIDEQTVRLHHDLHHAGYVKAANAILKKLKEARQNSDYSNIKALSRDLSFNVSGIYLHNLYWETMGPKRDTKPSPALAKQIEKDFGSFENMIAHMTATATTVEGSGWAILAWDPLSNQLLINIAESQQHASTRSAIPILPCDLWEHSYYLKYQNKRAEYFKAWLKVVDWESVSKKFAQALKNTL